MKRQGSSRSLASSSDWNTMIFTDIFSPLNDMQYTPDPNSSFTSRLNSEFGENDGDDMSFGKYSMISRNDVFPFSPSKDSYSTQSVTAVDSPSPIKNVIHHPMTPPRSAPSAQVTTTPASMRSQQKKLDFIKPSV
eukprot:TRINITY_DN220_c0_g4_i1.p1 TRINITY_DN220_c0_g4~~TRINITY_DN220_c0_g4_i1.p1  ORF type:complete len:142 (-),score=47.30 TRINITY_DN220_c0_g4_i1:70-474(-)